VHSRVSRRNSRVSWPRIVLACALFLLVATVGIAYTRSQLKASAASVKWTKVWSADFSGPAGAGVDKAQWLYETGHGKFGNGSIETMTSSPQNVHLSGNDELDITAVHQSGLWTSGRLRSVAAFTPPAGGEMQVVASIQQPDPGNGLGYWPAFWLLGEGIWPEHGEIDILEDVNTLSDHSGAFHCGNLYQKNSDGTLGPCHEYTGLSSRLQPCSQCQDGFHTYSVIVDLSNPDDGQIRWYLDGNEFFSVQETEVGAATWDEAIDHGFWIILDLAMGGSYPDQTCHCSAPDRATSSGGTMRVRNVAVYRA